MKRIEKCIIWIVDCVVNFSRWFGVLLAAVWFWNMFRVAGLNGDKVC